jgi:hypothetical protein
VRELSKKVHKFTEAEQFVFISAQFFVKFPTKYLPHRLLKVWREIQIKTSFIQLPYYVDALPYTFWQSLVG